jgi:hypothetical protein
MARQALERGPQARGFERTLDYVDDVQDAVNILVRGGVDEPRSLTSLTRESGVNLTQIMLSLPLC